jgi:hypothetical protein
MTFQIKVEAVKPEKLIALFRDKELYTTDRNIYTEIASVDLPPGQAWEHAKLIAEGWLNANYPPYSWRKAQHRFGQKDVIYLFSGGPGNMKMVTEANPLIVLRIFRVENGLRIF